MAQHTPGPWKVFNSIGEDGYPGIDADGIATIVVWGEANESFGIHGRTHDEAIANARLIAAAPNLLEALKDLAALYETSPGRDPVFVDKALDAIAKAEGGKA